MMLCTPLEVRLEAVQKANRLRELGPLRGVDFTSNDTLGFSRDPELRRRILAAVGRFFDGAGAGDAVAGAGGSRVLRGNLPIYEELERECAGFSGTEEALFYPSGYQANCGVLSGLLAEGDVVYSDSLNHASLIDGMRISKAQRRIFRHCDIEDLRRILREDREREGVAEGSLRLIVTESVFSMDGDLAPLEALIEVAEEFGAQLLVDEAHATGLWGSRGRGGGRVQALGLSDRVLATVHPAGKALGVSGAWVAGSQVVKSALVNFSRGFLFSTAPTPLLAVSLLEALRFWRVVGPIRAAELLEDSLEFKKKLLALGVDLGLGGGSASPIIPIIIGGEDAALKAARNLESSGLDVRAIRPPTVPAGSSRLRVMLHWGQGSESRKKLLEGVLRMGPHV